MNVKLVIEYEGTHYHGWQAQAGTPTVEAALRAQPKLWPDSVTVRLRDGDREVELHGPLPVCRQLLDELPQLWSRLRPQSGSPGAQGPSS